jgi:hypothetical protein
MALHFMNRNSSFIKIILLVAAGLLSSGKVEAQKYSFGLRAGGMLSWPGFADADVKDTFGRKLKPGYNVGLFVGFPMKKNYEVLIEGGASQRGRILTFNDGTWANHLTMQMTDMGMQLRRYFKFQLTKNVPIEAFVNIGPEINYWFNSKGYVQVKEGPKYHYKIHYGATAPNNGDRYMTLQHTNHWLFSLSVGAGVRAPLRNNHFLSTEFRFISGHTFMGKKDSAFMEGFIWGDGGMQDTFQTNLKTISLSVSYTISKDVIESRKGKSTLKKKLKRGR